MLVLHASAARAAASLAIILTVALTATAMAGPPPLEAPRGEPAAGEVMLILRGIAGRGQPRGQLDDQSALEYARRLGYRGEVLDVAGGTGAQRRMALDRIRHRQEVTALYGFSGGGYSTRRIWGDLNAEERSRIRKVVVVGSPGVRKSDFPASQDVVINGDPLSGHMAGPKALLDSLGPS